MLRRLFHLYKYARGDDLIGIISALFAVMLHQEVEPTMYQHRQAVTAIIRQLDEPEKYAPIIVPKLPEAQPVSQPEPIPAPEPTRSQTYTVTAYTAGVESTGKRPGDRGYGVTTSGAIVQEGVTVSCPPSIPLGTQIHIENVGSRVCQDRGGAIKGKRLDLYIKNLGNALEFGRQSLQVTIKG